MVDVSTSELPHSFHCRSQRFRRSSRLFSRDIDGDPSLTVYETVELSKNWTDEPDDVIDRPMTKLPCEIFLNRLLRTRVSGCIVFTLCLSN